MLLAASLAGSACAGLYPMGDIDGNRIVDLEDLRILAGQWLNSNCVDPGCEADLDGQNNVNLVDFALLAKNWGVNENTPVMSEFLASNGSSEPLEEWELLDEDGGSSDWIEIYNPADISINLNGWRLLNNDGNEIKEWEFPATELKPGEFLIVFASGKDRAVAGSELHTNFVLGADGDYLALAKSDGVTIAHEYTPEYPKQLTNISYGLLQDANTFVDSGATVSYHVPTVSDAQTNWTIVGFNDNSWDTAKTGLGFGLVQADLIDVTNPGDVVQGVLNNGNWPDNEAPPNAIDDNVNTKYLHFKEEDAYTTLLGFRVTPSTSQTIVTGLTFTTANDAPERDPTAYALYGSNVSINGPYTLIATGEIVDFKQATVWPRFKKNTTPIRFANTTAYNHYQLMYTTLRDVLAANSVQIAEVEFLGGPAGPASNIQEQMLNINASLWVRAKFNLTAEDIQVFDILTLSMMYEDGFVAYLNGVEVARCNFSGTPRWDSHADSNRPNDYAKDFETIDISEHADLLHQGTNVFAIHALNDSSADLNFLILPELVAGSTTRMNFWQYFAKPTPGKLNISGAVNLVADTKFSHDRGFYDAPFEVTITTQTEGAIIHYTTNGSTPSEVEGNYYTGPIPIGKTTCLRAIAFKPGWISTNVDTQTYIFLDQVIRQPASPAGFPTSWGSTTADYAMDQRVVNDTRYQNLMRDSLLSIPTISITTDMNNLFSPSGIYDNSALAGVAWERPASIEWIYPDGTTGFHVNAGLRIYGGDPFRGMNPSVGQGVLTWKKSFRLLFKRQYGPTKLDFPVFDTPGAATSFDTIVLRAGANDAWNEWSENRSGNGPNVQYILDEFIRRTQLALGQVSPHGTFVHLYLNGLYWGLYNPVERPMASFCATYYGGDKEEWDALNSGTPTGESSTTTWNAMMSQASAGLSDNTAYQKIQGNNPDGTKNPAYDDLLDIDNYIDWLFSNFWGGTADWPYHNFYVGCRRPPNTTGFKFFDWDAEYVIVIGSGLNSNVTGVSDNGARPYVTLRQNDDFRLLFADHAHRHLFNNGPAATEASYARYKELADKVELAIISESARWGDMARSTPRTLADWQAKRDYILSTYMPQRPAIVLQQLRGAGLYPNIAAPVFYINGSYKHGGQITKTDQLSMQNPNASGKIYYTIDGNDPRLPAQSQPGANVTLVTETAAKRVLIPAGAVSDAWKGGSEPFNDSLWNDATFISGKTGGVGYEASSGYENYISYDVKAKMYDAATKRDTCYIRIPFTFIGNPSELDFMTLKVRYDDGFVAYLNGTKVAGSNFPDPPAWNSSASGTNPDSAAVQFENIDISSYLGDLRSGNNILAIHGLNHANNRSDFLISVELVAGKGSAILSPSAIEYTTPIALDKSTVVKARVLSSSTWSALNEATYAVGPVKDKLRITEIMYHPADTGDPNDPNKEFIELKNIGTETLNLNLVRFTEGIHITFPPWELAAGEYVVVVRDLGVFEDQYGTDVNVAGQYSGSLDNAGERIRLEDAVGQMILDFAYKDGWRDITDGDGFSLTIINPADPNINHWGEKDYWRASALYNGSPGWDDSGIIPNPSDVVINEVLAHSHAGEPDWIELHNTTDDPINIGGWFLSDDDAYPARYRIASDTVIDRYGYAIFYEDTNFADPNDPGCLEVFRLSENGEEVCLSSAQGDVLTGYQEIQNFGASETGVSFGRYFKASINNVDFVAMSGNTPGWANAYPKVGPIVINEIMYNPSANRDAEFVELYNITGSKVDLFDIEGNTWKFNDEEYGIDYNLPANTSISAHGYLLLVKNKANFKSWYPSVPTGVQLLEWGDGRLNNGGEKIYISMPGDVDQLGQRHYIRVDMINYDNEAPWSLEPDGGGASLSRTTAANYGNDPNNWTSANPPTPGQ